MFKLVLATLLTIASAGELAEEDSHYIGYNPTSCACNNGVGSASSECPHLQEHCASCNIGYELITGATVQYGPHSYDTDVCNKCPVGKYIENGDLSCKECNAGMYNDQEGQQSCTFCDDGKTTVKGTNSACAAFVTQWDVTAAYVEGVASVTPEDGIGQADVDAAVNALKENDQALLQALASRRTSC